MIEFVEACQQLKRGERTGHPELAPFPNWQSVLGFIDEYPIEAQEIKTMVELIQSFGIGELISALNQVVTEKRAEVVISTVHRAKGREWNSVRLAGDFLHRDDMDKEDLRLAYVAVTRAQITLDMSAWERIVPVANREKFNHEPTVIQRNRPPIIVDAEVGTKNEKGIASRLKPWDGADF